MVFLFDSGGRSGLPAGPFLAKCTEGICSIVEGGHVPAPSPPSPAPQPPQPPVPTESNCTFQNSTTFKDDFYKRVNVPLNNYAACCELCVKDSKCVVAQMHHGPAHASHDYCSLMATAKKQTKNVVSPPNLELACTPKREFNTAAMAATFV